jgi:hypothetical protein
MLLLLKSIPVKVARYFKVPHHDSINSGSDLLRLRSFKSIIVGRQIAYKIHSLQRTLLFYKKANLTKFYSTKSVTHEWSAESVMLPLSHKNDFILYKRASNYTVEPVLDSESIETYFRFLDISNELYEVIIRHRYDKSGHSERVLSVVNFTKGETLLAKKVKGFLIASIPIYNNYMPTVTIKNNQIEVHLFDVHKRKLSKLAYYPISSLEKELYKFLLARYDSSRKEIKELIAHGRGSYRLGAGYDICEDFTVCKSFVHITNDTITGREAGIVFTIALTASKNVITCEILIPREASFERLHIDKVLEDHVIDSKTIQVSLPEGNYIVPTTLYYDEKYALTYHITNTEKYFIVSRDHDDKYLIDTTRDDMYKMYIAGEFIFVVFKTEGKRHWHHNYNILVYDTRRNTWRKQELVVNTYSDIGIYGCYYIKKCEKVVFLMYNKGGHSNSFYKLDENRRAVNIEQAIVIELSQNLATISFKQLSLEAIIKQYMRDKYSDKCSGSGVTNADCSVDVNKGIMYVTGINYKCDIPVITLECDLCNDYEVREFGIQYPIMRSQDMASDRAKPIYISTKALRNKGLPKYLPMHISEEFYDFITNKMSGSGMIFSSHSKFSVRDRCYNRIDGVLDRVDALKEAVNVALQDDIMMMYEINYRNLIAVMITHDLAVIKTK